MLFPFEHKIKLYIESHPNMISGDAVLVGVSGGPDSMGLLYVLHRLGYTIFAAHINYQLRGKDSTLDQKLVRSFCEAHQIKLFSTSFDTVSLSEQSKKGIQELAREMRYDWFKKICKETSIRTVATGHHMEDQAETLLFNLIRGSGIKGAAGIFPSRVLEPSAELGQNIRLIRPLLNTKKSEIVQYLDQMKVTSRQDLSNLKDEYSRNKIRHHILPRLNEIIPHATAHLADFSNHVQAILPYYSDWVLALKRAHLIHHPDYDQISLTVSLPPSLIFILLQDYGFNSSQAHQIHQAVSDQHTGSIFYSKEFQLTIGSERSDLVKTMDFKTAHGSITSLPYVFEHLGFKFLITKVNPTTIDLDGAILMNFDELLWPLTLRTWQAGDKMAPLGMNGYHKKIQDILTDKKVSGVIRKNALVLLSGEEIIWLWPCNVISEQFKLISASVHALQINLMKIEV